MKDDFEQIREQIHEIRNFIGPLDIKLATLENHVTASRISFETKTLQLESKFTEFNQRLGRNTDELIDHSERIRRIEALLKITARAE